MSKKIVIAGGTGFIGTYLEQGYKALGYEVIVVSRQPGHTGWDEPGKITEALEGAELLVNLAGKSVNCRYHRRNREAIVSSRTETTRILGDSVSACRKPPRLWINASTATIYRHADDRPMTETGGELGTGFSVEVAKAWEKAFFAYALPGTRQVALRLAIVLGDGGVMTPYRHLVRFGLGGAQGSGGQRFSWIHVEDVFRIVRFLEQKDELSGVFNASSPDPVTNREFMRILRHALNRSIGLPAPRWMLEIGALAIRTETELILKSRWVLPERLTSEGYAFAYPGLDTALRAIVRGQ
ncbi:TIGR01777 family oxidoreductase [Paenibacillus arenilitoris]|uniref:TIGR01777 family protein n=1 Tax=Paenibacillus arenilitoris TaxID=2772299 RepID=A0A927CPM9_9BACL|nr:TIGR01777 family oxidoreductase [Paenibacillus arenilitoris]MBD2869961.1 TIGR01777 family protein [Paenibacillus arenilitoris]